MNAPLYSEARDWLSGNGAYACPARAHHGLWFERFYAGFSQQDWSVPKPSKDGGDEVKRNWVQSVSGAVGDAKALDNAADRLVDLIAARHGDFRCLHTDWHFVTGLGLPHPIENGFAWHPTLAVPYLGGAAVKGLLRAYLEAWEDPVDLEKLKRWFGTAKKSDVPERAGDLVFFDALPIKPPRLGCDVMTPHMGKWYELGGDNPLDPKVTPADWHSPVPVPFPVVEDATLLFGIAPRRYADAEQNQATADLAAAMDGLVQALDWLGAGAKTAAGYGHMQPDNGSDTRLREALAERRSKRAAAKTLEQMGPSERKVQQHLEKHPGNPAVELLRAIESGVFTDPETVRVAARKAQAAMQADGTWMPDFSGANKTRLKHRDRSRKIRDFLEPGD
jgi:CRISPR-associated protein Cmr6